MTSPRFCNKRCNLFNEGRRGFTLVELIVALVILAILAALLIPAFSDYIYKAKERAVISETRQAVTAAQAVVSESYGLGSAEPSISQIMSLSETPGEVYAYTNVRGRVQHLCYGRDEMYCTYCALAQNGQACGICQATQTYSLDGQSEFYPRTMLPMLNPLCTTTEANNGLPKVDNKAGNLNAYFSKNSSDPNNPLRQIDSNAPAGDGVTASATPWATAVIDLLQKNDGFNATAGTWAMVAGNKDRDYKYNFYYTTAVIGESDLGKTVKATKFDPNTGVSESGSMTVYSQTKTYTINGKSQNITYYGLQGSSFSAASSNGS